jgi:putative PIN family toxin of toxin-antitoxin system
VQAVRATVDTSAWVSAVLSRTGRAARLIDAFEAGAFALVTSAELLAETEEVLSRPKLSRTATARRAAHRVTEAVRERAEVVVLVGDLQLCRDPNDDMVIETALLGSVDVIVTGDKDLLEDPGVLAVLSAAGVRVMTIAQFLDELGLAVS